jgi:uncharacterized protein (DUF1501 family)
MMESIGRFSFGSDAMLHLESKKAVPLCDGMSRRDFLRVGSLTAGAVGLSLADYYQLQQARATNPSDDINCILLFLVGGPSHLDTFDLKPDAPDDVRGPFRPIKTNVPGVEICEHFPLMARMADRYAILRSVHHSEAPIHETGHQLMQTGRLFRAGQEYPHYGAVVSHLRGRKAEGLPPFAVLPGPIGNTGVSVSHGQTAGFLGAKHEPFVVPADVLRTDRSLPMAVDEAHRAHDQSQDAQPCDAAQEHALDTVFSARAKQAFDLTCESDGLRDRYGRNTFGQSCLLARRLVEHGVRFATVNMFDTVFNEITWDCHADGGSLPTNLNDYKETLCPMFDRAYSALLDDLKLRGMLDSTLVLAMGEFGRTPHLNPRGGRDHWPGCWSVLFAGANVQGGRVVGASDPIGAEPKDVPVTPAEVAATVYQAMGIDGSAFLPGPDNHPTRVFASKSVRQLLRS